MGDLETLNFREHSFVVLNVVAAKVIINIIKIRFKVNLVPLHV